MADAELLAALGDFIDHVEEVNLMVAELLLRTRGSELRVLSEDFASESPVTYLEALRCYEKLCREARVKWNLPPRAEE
jgi:hypothetical protein